MQNSSIMPKGLVRCQQCGCFHFLTFRCCRRQPLLDSATACGVFERLRSNRNGLRSSERINAQKISASLKMADQIRALPPFARCGCAKDGAPTWCENGDHYKGGPRASCCTNLARISHKPRNVVASIFRSAVLRGRRTEDGLVVVSGSDFLRRKWVIFLRFL